MSRWSRATRGLPNSVWYVFTRPAISSTALIQAHDTAFVRCMGGQAVAGAGTWLDWAVSDDLVIAVDKATVTRNRSDLIRSVSWQVELDERWVVLGPNGAGKTTLLNLAGARLYPTRGTVTVLGEKLGRTNINELKTRLAFSSAGLQLPPDET